MSTAETSSYQNASRNSKSDQSEGTTHQGRNQGGGLRGLKPPLSQVKVEKKYKQFKFLADFMHTTQSKCYCNIIIPFQLFNFVAF